MQRRFIGVTAAAAILGALIAIPVSAQQAQAPRPTPRDANGKPDLTGVYTAGGGGGVNNGSGVSDAGDIVNNLTGRSSEGGVLGQAAVNFEQDNTLIRRMDPNRPLYRPEHWDRVKKLDLAGNFEDPAYRCLPEGIPRMGPPAKIIMLKDEAVFLYSGRDTFREIPTDGRPFTPDNDLEGTWMGEGRGRWEGDTFVVESTGFTDSSWLGIAGYFHSENMRVFERFTLQGNQLTWQATVVDPETFLKPWVMNPVRRVKNSDPKAILAESLPCYERDVHHLVTNERH